VNFGRYPRLVSTLFVGHVLFAVIGLSLVEPWIPGRGRHATGRSVDYTRRGYFPILAATGHVMADIGHTDPQWIIPYGGSMTVDGPARRITAHY